MGIKKDALALADELEAFEDGDCEECIAYGQPECKGHLSCAEIIARYSARKVREIAENDAEDVTTVSAYDLLGDEDREALAWVREMGGVEAVKARTMPEGCEWPRFEDGEPVRVGDKLMTSDGAVRVEELSLTICDTDGGVTCVPFGERVKRPENPVLAADGKPLRVGETVWDVESGTEYEVVSIYIDEENPVRVMRTDGSHLAKAAKPSTLSHQRPVLDADGVPIKVGDTVYEVGENYPPFIVGRLPEPDAYRSVRVVYPSGAFTSLDPERLTHTKPEPPDSWERIEEDVELSPADYISKYGRKTKLYAYEEVPRDLVRRCKALAEMGEL